MRTLLTTAGVHPRDSFRLWRTTIHERIVPVELSKVGDRPFEGRIDGADIGGVRVSRVAQTAIRTEATPATIRRHDKHETLSVAIMLEGTLTCRQGERVSVQRIGEFVVLDRKPTVMMTDATSVSLVLEVPRTPLERMLGPAALYAGLTVGAAQATTSLITSFFRELIEIDERLLPEMAERMSSIGLDLLIAGLAERLARDTPKPLSGTILLRRAKAHVEANLSDPDFTPSDLALGSGVSLRRLQQLFREDGLNIADWIWKRRLEVAVHRLSDPGYVHVPIGALAFGCGFNTQAHFSRRFKDRYGVTPTECREAAMKTRPKDV